VLGGGEIRERGKEGVVGKELGEGGRKGGGREGGGG